MINSLFKSIAISLMAISVTVHASQMETIEADNLLFSELECYMDDTSQDVGYSLDSSLLTFPLTIAAKGINGRIRIDVDGKACWIAPETLVLRSTDEQVAAGKRRSRGVKFQNYAVVTVHYGTNRKPTGKSDPASRFAGERGELSYGTCDVSIPRDHRLGQLEQPTLWRMEFNPDPSKHVVLMNVSPQSQPNFLAGVRERVSKSKSRSLFVFVHGYNVNFANAARRTAQMTYDLGYDGAPIFFSWPSQAKLQSYVQDENNNEWSIPDLQVFLSDIAQQGQGSDIYLIAHSMGNRVATRALSRLLTEQPKLRERFKEVLLIAPDIDVDVFKRDIAPVLLKDKMRVTLYASNKDRALQASRSAHGFPRLGEASPITLIKGMDTIDATAVETDLLGHTYFASAKSVLSDIFDVIRDRRPVNVRQWLREVVTDAGKYWKFQKP